MSDDTSTRRDAISGDADSVDRPRAPLLSLDGLLPSPSSGGGADGEVIQRAGDFISHLRSQLAELDRREQNVNAQYSALDQERRRLRFSIQQSEEQVRQREEDVARREEEFSAKFAAWETSQKDVESQRELLRQEQTEVAATKERLETEAVALLEVERDVIAQDRAELDRRITAHEESWRAAITDIDTALDQERASRTEIMEQELADLEAEILEKRQWWDEEQTQCLAKFEEERVSYDNQLAALSVELVDLRQQKLADIEQQEHDLQRQKVDVEKRTRFHESHLDQLRRSLERKEQEIDQLNQQVRLRHVETDERLRLHARQMQSHRELLEHREESLDRERDLLAEAKQTLEKLRIEEEARIERTTSAWDQECESHRSDMRRQQDLLTLHAENLEGRRSRLDHLRDELEESHRETLEMRVAIEQSWAQLSQTFGEETSRQRIEQSRAALSEHYEQVRNTIEEQRQSLEEAHQRLQEQREQVRKERQDFSDWISEKNEQLRQREETVQQELDVVVARESQWCSTRERWLQEKVEAESVIRQLLSELDAGLATACPFDPLLTPADAAEREPAPESLAHPDDDTAPAAA